MKKTSLYYFYSLYLEMSKKTAILRDIYTTCYNGTDVFTCTNDVIKELAKQYQFKNPFDVSKVDKEDTLPEEMRLAGFKGIFYGKDGPYFVRRNCFHYYDTPATHEKININSNPFCRTKSCSENISVMHLQKLLPDFLGIQETLNVGIFGRLRNLEIKLNMDEEFLSFNSNQIEIDMSYFYTSNDEEYIVYCELKRNSNKSFNVNQLYHCYMFNEYVCKCNNKNYKPVFLMINSDKNNIHISQFQFEEEYKPWSIRCIQQKTYTLEYN